MFTKIRNFIRASLLSLAILIGCVAPLAVASSAHAQATYIRYVDIYSGSTNGDGTDWGVDAFKYLQDALAEAQDILDFDAHPQSRVQLWVVGHPNPQTATANGYRPDLDAGLQNIGDRTKSFELKNRIEIYGGFAGTETQLQQRDPKTYITVLLGDLAGDDDWEVTYDLGSGLPIISVSPTAIDDNSYHVVFAENTDDTAILDGFTIRGGNADSVTNPSVAGRGGGIYLVGSDAIVRNCIVRFNRAYPSQTNPGTCEFVGGGGLSVERSGTKAGQPRIQRCTIVHNIADRADGGGVVATSPVVLIHCNVNENAAFACGGGLNISGLLDGEEVTLINTIVRKNVAGSSRSGIAAHNAQHEQTPPKIRLWSCLIADNSGVGLTCNGYAVEVSNCTFANNDRVNDQSSGNAITLIDDEIVDPATLDISNSIIWGRSGSTTCSNQPCAVVVNPSSTTVSVEYCDVQGGTSGFTVTPGTYLNNLNADPEFGKGYRVTRYSPCRDAGDDSLIALDEFDLNENGNNSEPQPFDAAWRPRVENIVEMGCFEFVGAGPGCPCDLDSSGAIDIYDLMALLSDWGPCPTCDTDITGDGVVDIYDLIELLDAWGPCDGYGSESVPSTVQDCMEKYDPGTIELEQCLELLVE